MLWKWLIFYVIMCYPICVYVIRNKVYIFNMYDERRTLYYMIPRHVFWTKIYPILWYANNFSVYRPAHWHTYTRMPEFFWIYNLPSMATGELYSEYGVQHDNIWRVRQMWNLRYQNYISLNLNISCLYIRQIDLLKREPFRRCKETEELFWYSLYQCAYFFFCFFGSLNFICYFMVLKHSKP